MGGSSRVAADGSRPERGAPGGVPERWHSSHPGIPEKPNLILVPACPCASRSAGLSEHCPGRCRESGTGGSPMKPVNSLLSRYGTTVFEEIGRAPCRERVCQYV